MEQRRGRRQPRDTRISLRLRDPERALVEAVATHADEAVSQFVRRAVLAAARRAARDAGVAISATPRGAHAAAQ